MSKSKGSSNSGKTTKSTATANETSGPKSLKNEDWKPIAGFPGYRVSNRGRIFSDSRDGLMATHKGRLVVLQKSKKPYCRSVGKLVYEAFVGKVAKGTKVRTTKNGDYSVGNLVAGSKE